MGSRAHQLTQARKGMEVQIAQALRTITVAELIEALQGEDPAARVLFSTDYGDYSHTPQALPISGDFEEAIVEKSAYSNSGFAVVQDEEAMYDETDPRNGNGKFLVIR